MVKRAPSARIPVRCHWSSRTRSKAAASCSPATTRAPHTVPASKRQAGHGRSRTHVQFLSSGLGCSMACLLPLASTVALSLVDDHAGAMRGTGGGTRGLSHVYDSGRWRYSHPPHHSDADELLEAGVAGGVGGGEGDPPVPSPPP